MSDECAALFGQPDLGDRPEVLSYPTLLQELAREALERRPRYEYRGRSAEQVRARLRVVRREVRRRLNLPAGAGTRALLRVIERRSVQFDGFSIRPVAIERLRGWTITAHLYLPDGVVRPAPAVMHVHGHHYQGKSTDCYARRCRGLARRGFVVLSVDFPGADERESTGHALWYPTMANLPLQRIMVEDNAAALTYLAGLPFVDARRIGVTGSSGGGNQTVFLAIADRRVAAAAPTNAPCMVAEHAASGSGAYCHCEAVPGLIAAGIEYHDLIAAIAPRPLRVFAGIRDPLFPIIGARRAVEMASQAYRALGAEGGCTIEEHYCTHSVPDAMRQGSYRFFERVLRRPGDVAGPGDEGDDVDLTDPRLKALPKRTGRLLTVADLYRRELGRRRPEAPTPGKLNRVLGRRASDAEVTLGSSHNGRSPSAASERAGLARHLLRTADGGVVPVVVRAGESDAVVLVVADGGKRQALEEVGGSIAAFDWRGQGETAPPSDEWQQRAAHYLAMSGSSLPGGRVTDLIATAGWLRRCGRAVAKVVALGGHASLIALLAASVDENFPLIECHGLPRTLEDAPGLIGQVHYSAWAPGLAVETDIPQALRALGGRAVVRSWLEPGEEGRLEGYT